MLEWPRSAFIPPPATPILPSRSWIIAMVRMFWEPTECCVQPSASRLDSIVFEREAARAAQEGNVGPGRDRGIEGGERGGAGEARIDRDQLGLVLDLGFDHPFEAARMRLGSIVTHAQHDIGVLDVLPG